MSIAAKIGCVPQTRHEWVKKVEVDSGKRAGVPTEMADRLKSLERENRELRQANEIPRKASAYFAQAELGSVLAVPPARLHDKAEVIHRRGPWRSFETVEYATLEWVDWSNNRRLLEPIGNIPPAEAEERYYAMLDDVSMAA